MVLDLNGNLIKEYKSTSEIGGTKEHDVIKYVILPNAIRVQTTERHVFLNKDVRDLENIIKQTITQQRIAAGGQATESDRYAVDLMFYISNPCADLDNPLKPTLDLLAKGGIFSNDKYVLDIHLKRRKAIDKEHKMVKAIVRKVKVEDYE